MKNDDRNAQGETLQSALTIGLLAVDPDCCYLKALYKEQRLKELKADILHDVLPDVI